MSARTDLCGGYRATDIPTAILGGPRMVNDVNRTSHGLGTSWEVNRMSGGARERALKLHASREGLSGKAEAKTGIGKSDLPGL